jgi:hypothetical protein
VTADFTQCDRDVDGLAGDPSLIGLSSPTLTPTMTPGSRRKWHLASALRSSGPMREAANDSGAVPLLYASGFYVAAVYGAIFFCSVSCTNGYATGYSAMPAVGYAPPAPWQMFI